MAALAAPARRLPRAPFDDWRPVASYRPPENVQKIVLSQSLPDFPWFIQKIESAQGSTVVNLDLYEIRVDRMPTVSGSAMTGETLLEHIRLRLGEFLDPARAEFEPNTNGEAALWKNGIPGALMKFDLKQFGANAKDAMVVLGVQEPRQWVFSTVFAGETDNAHPVRGNRQFGIAVRQGVTFVYTRGADRTVVALPGAERMIFDGGDALWRGYQQRVSGFVTSNGGSATVVPPVINRPAWNEVKAAIHKPTIPWV